MSTNKTSKLLDVNTAVESYLDNLLQEATEPVKAVPKAKVVPVVESLAEVEVEEVTTVIPDNVHVLDTPLMGQTEVDVATTQSPVATTEEVTFEFPVQCLMFKVEGHLLAIPLIKMGSVVPWGGRLSQLPYSPDYFKGLLKHRDENVKVVDTAVILGDVRKDPTAEFKPSHVLVFENNDWAISCDELLDVVKLEESDVKWHAEGQNRLSLGTVKDSLALILSPQAISDYLLNSEKDK